MSNVKTPRLLAQTVAALVILGIAAGCTPSDGKTELSDKRKEAVAAIQEYAYAQKADYVARMNKDLVALQAEMDALSVKIERSSSTVKADAKLKLEAAHGQWLLAKAQLDKAESSSEAGWNDMKSGFSASYGALEKSLNETRQWMSDKIEP